MKIRIIGAGWYGCHLAASLLEDGHDVEVHEMQSGLFQGASGKIPARLHLGAHYPRSHKTRAALQRHTHDFMDKYGFLTRGVPINLYAIAKDQSYVDFDQYTATLRNEFEFITVHQPAEYGLRNVEGAILVGERHILADKARSYFANKLDGKIRFNAPSGVGRADDFDFTIDCTFCANDAAGVDRYEPCLVLLLEGETDKAVTIMDGPFPSLYPWLPDAGLCSLSSALFTPFSKTIKTYNEASDYLAKLSYNDKMAQAECMIDSMSDFYFDVLKFRMVDMMLSIRAMPLSGADTRLVDVVRADERLIRVRAGKIDAILDAERMVKEMIG